MLADELHDYRDCRSSSAAKKADAAFKSAFARLSSATSRFRRRTSADSSLVVIDHDDDTVTCPAGHTRPISPSRSVTFGKLCTDCPLRARCTTAKTGRSMSIHQYEALLRAARAQGRTPEFKLAYPIRSNIERTISHVATQNGRRIKLRHLDTDANNAWLRSRAAALNLRTLLKHGLTHGEGTWILA